MGTACHARLTALGAGGSGTGAALALPVVTHATQGRRPSGDPADRSSPVTVQLVRLDPQLPAPSYAHPGDAGADLHCREDVSLEPGERRRVGTGVAIALPTGFVGLVHPRSGLAARHGLTLVNAPGTVDAGYRGEIMVTLLNTDRRSPVVLRRGDRIAQLVVQRVEQVSFVEVEALPDSARGSAGFGSTGGFGSAPAASSVGVPVRTAGDRQDSGGPGGRAGQGVDEAGDSPGRGEQW